MHGGFHPKFVNLGLYAPRREGGRGLVSIGATIQEETAGLQEYISKMVPTDDLQSKRLKQLKPSMEDEPESYHGRISPRMACTTAKLKRWLTSEKPSNG